MGLSTTTGADLRLFAASAAGPEAKDGFDWDVWAIGSIVKVVLLLLGGAVLVGGIIAYVALRRAPDGVEDDDGFHQTDDTKR